MLVERERSGASEAAEEVLAVKRFLKANPRLIREDSALLRQLGLRTKEANVIDFGPVALSRVSAAHRRESSERRRLEGVARANFGAQAQTHAAVIDLLASRDSAELAGHIDTLSRERFDLAAGVLALEGPEGVPHGWRALAKGQVDLVLGPQGLTLMGHAPIALGLFPGGAAAIGSVAVVRLCLWRPARSGLLAFGSADCGAFTADMGVDLLAFLARVVERTAERWPNR